MLQKKPLAVAVRAGLGLTTAMLVAPAIAQDASGDIEEVVVTGTHIKLPGTVSASPIQSLDTQEISFRQEGEVERILKVLPSMAFGDGGNVNNGTEGVTTLNLRGLGSQRNLILMNSKRVTPYDPDGIVDVSNIPTALIERIDIVTGGASAVYGSDAVSGAINFIMKDDFEGVALDTNYSETEDYGGDNRNMALTIGANVADGRGNVVATVNWTDRESVLLGSQALGRLGIASSLGADFNNLSAYYDGSGAPAAPANCSPNAPGVAASGGSSTTIPTRVAISGGPGLGQFRDDGTLGANCSVFNFNPFNYYQTPQERTGGMALGRFEINEHAEAYGSINFSSTKVKQQVAPSGIFGSSFFTPLANPLIGASALNTILTTANAGVAAGTVNSTNWIDANSNGMVDAADELRIQYRRRTLEFGERSTEYSNDYFQVVGGLRGDIAWDWTYDFSVSYGNSDRTNRSAGYTNVANFEQALRTTDGVTCENGDTTCVPINVFGGFGSITPAMAAYSSASAVVTDYYEQKIYQLILSGPVEQARLPWADNPLALSFGYEQREDESSTEPDECWKLQPASCLGGAGGAILPISGGYKVEDLFVEAILPIVNDQPFAKELTIEAGYRVSDYDFTDETDTWKYGVNWRPVDSLMVRAMKQRAVRAPNVGELFSPVTSSLDNAQRDPCSAANPGAANDPVLRERCILTGMTPAQVGTVENIVAGQINIFSGSNPNDLPEPEEADTVTIGFVWTPDSSAWWDRSTGLTISVDYYDIDVDGYIDEPTPQEVLDACYEQGDTGACGQIRRIFGTLTEDGSGVESFTTNLEYIQAEGVEFAFSTGVSLGEWGELNFSGTANYYLTQEFQSSSTTPVIDCVGRYGVSCGAPLPWFRFIQRTTWEYGDYTVSAQWRYFGETQVENASAQWHPNVGDQGGNGGIFPKFQEIDEYNYLDLFGSYNYRDIATISLGVDNVFAKHPPVVGNAVADTSSNSGNTFPSTYDTLGRVYRMGVDLRF